MLVIAIMIVAAGSALQAATGMGMALFAAPLLALIDPAFVPGPVLCAVMGLSAAVAWRERAFIDRRILFVALLGFSAGCAIGAILVAVLVGRDLGQVFAVLILAAVFLSVAGLRIRISRLALLIGGAASGIERALASWHPRTRGSSQLSRLAASAMRALASDPLAAWITRRSASDRCGRDG